MPAGPYAGPVPRRLALPMAVLLLAGCGPTLNDGAASSEVATHFLYFKKNDARYEGGVGSIFVEVAPNPGHRAPVRFAETVSGGTGDAWRATIWMALLSASAVLDIDPLSLRVTVEADGAVDGPSAGALLTAVIVAAVLRDPVLPNAILTGIINPDLTVGPVGGVPEKVMAALDIGMTRIGVPVGQESAPSLTTHQPVDVLGLVEKRGARSFVVKDVADAYEVLTGKTLATHEALDAKDMAFPDWAGAVFKKHAELMVADVERAQADLKPVIDQITDEAYRKARDALLQHARQVRELVAQNQAVSAVYLAAQTEGEHFDLATAVLTVIGVQLGKWEYVRTLLRGLHGTVAQLLDTVIPQWKRDSPRDPVEVPYSVDTFEAFIHALRDFAEANEALQKAPALKRFVQDSTFTPTTEVEKKEVLGSVQAFFTRLVSAQQNLLLGRAYVDVGTAWIALGRRVRKDPLPEGVLRSLSSEYEKVADANLEYVDKLLIIEEANQRSENPEKTRQRLLEVDSDYRQAVINRRLPGFIGANILTGHEQLYAGLSGAVSSYFAAVSVVSKRYSLNAVFSADGRTIVAIRNDTAMKSMLALADRQARQVAAQCRSVLGEVPVSTLIEYDLGQSGVREGVVGPQASASERSEAVQRQIEALGHLWRATTMGRLAIGTTRRLRAATVEEEAHGAR